MATATEEREAFLAERQQGIGGSDVAAICGISPWKTPLEVWREKLGLAEPVDENPAMRWGNILEDPVAREYAVQTGRRVRMARKLRVHKRHPFLIAHLDRTVDPVPGEKLRRIVEVKTVGQWAKMEEWGEPGTDEIPAYYLTQAHHNLAVTGADVCDVPVLIAGQDFRIYTVEKDPEMEESLLEILRPFWDQVLHRRAPDPTSADEVNQRFRFSRAGTLEATEEVEKAAARLSLVRTYLDRFEAEREELETTLKRALGDDGDALSIPVGKATRILARWKTQAANRFDVDAFRARFPALAQEFTRTTTSRPFRFEKKNAAKLVEKYPHVLNIATPPTSEES